MKALLAPLPSVFAILLMSTPAARAASEVPVQARFFGGITAAQPDNLNAELRSQGLKDFDGVLKFGVEATYKVGRLLDVGFNYTRRYAGADETVENPNTDFFAKLSQDNVMAIARVPFLKTSLLRMDAFASVGGSNTSVEIKTATQNGQLSRRESGDWFASLTTSYGASIAVGWKSVYLVLEGGFENNKIKGMKTSGTLTSSVRDLDLSGNYVTIGLLIDGLPATRN